MEHRYDPVVIPVQNIPDNGAAAHSINSALRARDFSIT
jgi:hypothetical protein